MHMFYVKHCTKKFPISPRLQICSTYLGSPPERSSIEARSHHCESCLVGPTSPLRVAVGQGQGQLRARKGPTVQKIRPALADGPRSGRVRATMPGQPFVLAQQWRDCGHPYPLPLPLSVRPPLKQRKGENIFTVFLFA